VPPTDPEISRRFAEEVQPHESELRGTLRSKFSVHLDIDDLVQETYVRLLQAREQTPLRSAKAYLFTTARNAAFDLFRRRKIVAIDGIAELELLPVFEDRPGVA
jgi:RNA polymerase sigma-70 factor (ECF subfamily)